MNSFFFIDYEDMLPKVLLSKKEQKAADELIDWIKTEVLRKKL